MAKDDVDKCSKAYRESAAFKRASFHPPDEIWGMFADADGFMDVLCTFQALVDSLNIDQNVNGLEFYKILKSKLTSWKCQSLWDLLNARVKCSEYRHENVSVGKNMRCIIIGAGPIGLRTAIEMLMLGCRTVVVEKRKDFSRNNVLHLWPFLLHDFRTLGAKKFYGKFGAGCIDHINIKTLQTILLKIALVLGVEIYNGVEFKDIIEPNEDHGWRACFDPVNHENLSKQDFDVIIGADGKKNVLPGFAQVELRGSLAIGITCNFINNNTPEETSCKEISGISYQFKPAFFEELKTKHGVELENIVYYKDETHYFVMTARKPSLLEQGVILKDYADPILLVKPTNINKTKLLEYTRNAVRFSTTLSKLEFKKLPNGQPDIALFDFTSLKKAENASRIIERNKHKLLLALVGDSLIEPFWPTGSGCGRGVLSALDVAWMVRQFALNYPPLAMIRERENVFKLLSASTHDNTQKNYSLYTIDPKTRYSALDTKKITNLDSLKSLYDTDDLSADLTLSSPSLQPKYYTKKRTAVERKKSGGGGASRPSGRTVAGKTKRKLERQESKTTKNEEKKLSIKDKKDVFEEHIKKMGMGTDVPKPKRATTSDEFSGLEGIDEDINESDDDVMVDEEPSTKKNIGQDKNASLKKQTSKDPGETTKGKVLKRTPSKESVKRQGSKSLKRQSSKEGELSELDPISEDMPSTRKKVFHAKGGGLKSKTRNESRKSSEKSDSGKTRHKSTKRKSRKSAGSSSEIEASREEPIQPVDSKTFFSKWLEALLPRLSTNNTNTPPPATYEHPLDVCIQTSVISVMAMSLLYDCNKPPRRRTTELKLKEIIANANARDEKSQKPITSVDKQETDELAFINKGRVRDSMAKWQKLVETEEQKQDYYDFIRKTNKESAALDIDKKDGILLVKHQNAEFTPKDVIDVETQLIAEEEEERKRSRLAKMSTGIPSNGEIELQLALEQFCDQQSPSNAILMLQVIYNIHKRILDEPSVDKHYRIYTKGKTFGNYVWQWEGAREYFQYIGWVLCGDFLVLSQSQPVHLIVKVIEDVFRKNKKVELLYSGSLKSKGKLSDEHHIHIDASNLTEDEFTNIVAPPERDSAIGSGMDDDDELDIKSLAMEHDILKRLESKEHNMGDEQYIVVDFVNHSNNAFEPNKNKRDSDILVENSSPFTAVKTPNKVNGDFTFEPTTIDEIDPCRNEKTLREPNEPYLQIVEARVTQIDVDLPIPSKTEKFVINDNVNNKGCAIDKPGLMSTAEIVMNTEKPRNELTNGYKHDLKNERCTDRTLKFDVTVEKGGFEVQEELQPPVTPTATGRRRVFSAGHGLKKRKDSDPMDVAKNANHDISRRDSRTEISRSTPVVRKDLHISPVHTLPSPKKTSPDSIKSPNYESSPASIVRQNKLLFDQQIANELKKKYKSPEDRVSPRYGSLGKAGINGFERKGSLKEKSSPCNSYSDSCDLDLTGIVAGTRSIFEGGNGVTEIKRSTSNTTIKELERVRNKEAAKKDSVKSTPVSCESVIINNVPGHSSTTEQQKPKKKKFPFKKSKGKGDKKKQENNKNVELIGATLIEANQSYDERAIDVEPVTFVKESPYEREKACSISSAKSDTHDKIHQQSTEITSSLPEIDKNSSIKSRPLSLSADHLSEHEGGEIRRNRSKKRRLCKSRTPSLNSTESISNSNGSLNVEFDPTVNTNDVTSDDTFVSGTIVSLIPNSDEEVLTETIITDSSMSNWCFDKLEDIDNEVVVEEQCDTSVDTGVSSERLMTLPSIDKINVDIDSLQNESSIDDDLCDNNDKSVVVSSSTPTVETENIESIKMGIPLIQTNDANINIGETNGSNGVDIEAESDDLNSILDEMSDATGSIYDGDSTSLSLSLNMDTPADQCDEKRKKKKKFPFHLKLGKKKDKPKGDGLASPDHVFSEDASSESSLKLPKKKKKSKSIEDLRETGHAVSASGNGNFPKLSSSSSLGRSPNLSLRGTHENVQTNSNEKSKSKKLPFFKKKKSNVSSTLPDNHLDPNDKLNGTNLSAPGTPTTPKHQHVNGHTNDANGHTSYTNGHTNGHTNHNNGHTDVNRENLI